MEGLVAAGLGLVLARRTAGEGSAEVGLGVVEVGLVVVDSAVVNSVVVGLVVMNLAEVGSVVREALIAWGKVSRCHHLRPAYCR